MKDQQVSNASEQFRFGRRPADEIIDTRLNSPLNIAQVIQL